ncbi:hypothetical protein QBC35DRAFT_447720 [Podospora australis]|uniref:Uncharacterized protein n=1 Tax=Podospora australis TaxID=1536484 RepID=A0AAN6X4H5_9PEZI|nr:hypothetical protein QBC35DRAFT_447720 [Podospora australis]
MRTNYLLLSLLASAAHLASASPTSPQEDIRRDLGAANLPRDPSGLDLVTALAPRQATTTAANQATLLSPSPCFTETTVTITQCPTDSAGKKTGQCTPTPSPSQVCREGLICRSDNQGNPSCMYKHSKLDIGGIIIAIFFAVAVVISVFTICFMCCRERQAQTRLEKAAEAAKIAKESAVAAKRPGRNVVGNHGVSETIQQREPLMDAASGYGGAASVGVPGGGDVGVQPAGGQYGAANPFVDNSHDGHPMR